jgi:hypothetical protein
MGDGTGGIRLGHNGSGITAGALSAFALTSVDIQGSGAMTLRGGGVSQFGDDTGYFNFSGAGALTTSGLTSVSIRSTTTNDCTIGAANAYIAVQGTTSNNSIFITTANSTNGSISLQALGSGGGIGLLSDDLEIEANTILICETGGAITIGDVTETLTIASYAVHSQYGNLTIQAGATLGTTSTGNINLPNNVNARFKIEGSAVSANVTAANLGTLTAGSSSNADSLHTHTGLVASMVDVTLTTTGLATGDCGYISSTNTLTKTDNTNEAKTYFVGVVVGTNLVRVSGIVDVNMKAGDAPAVGDPIYVAETANAGKLVHTAPTSGFILKAGIVTDITNYAGSGTVKMLIQVGNLIAL